MSRWKASTERASLETSSLGKQQASKACAVRNGRHSFFSSYPFEHLTAKEELIFSTGEFRFNQFDIICSLRRGGVRRAVRNEYGVRELIAHSNQIVEGDAGAQKDAFKSIRPAQEMDE